MKRYERGFYIVSSLLVFIFGLQLLGESTQAIADVLEPLIKQLITGDLSALGAGWFLAYMVLNGATSAAIGIAFLESGLITVSNAFMMISGSRLGAAFIVIFIGVLEYIQGKNPDLRDSCSIGILQFLATYIMYLPAIILGYWLLENFDLSFLQLNVPPQFYYGLDVIFGPAVTYASENLIAPVSFIGAVLLLVWSLQVFDKGFKGIGGEKFRSKYLRFQLTNHWLAFGLGALITFLTTSVALSVGIIVPLYNRGYFRRKEILPYLMGANITTMVSSLMAAAVMRSGEGIMVALLLTFTVTLVTIAVLLFYDTFYKYFKKLFDGIMLKDSYLIGFSLALLFVPLILVFAF